MADEKIIGKNISAEAAVGSAGLNLTNEGKVNHATYHHEELMDQFVKVIQFTKMDRKTRSVLLLRLIHGYTIQRMQIYLFLHGHITGNSRDELLAIEEHGKNLIRETLRQHKIEDIIKSINATPGAIAGLRNELTTPKPFLGLS